MTAPAVPLLRTSERNDFKRCPWLWHESWVKGMTTIRTPTWSWFGTAVHKGLEARYPTGNKRGSLKKVLEAAEESMDGEVRRVWSEGGELEDDEVVDARELMFAMLRGYVEHYGEERGIEVIHSEQSFQIDVPHPSNPDEVLCVYAGTWDSLWRIDGRYKIVDHKTRKQFPSNWDFYDINDQAGSYLWVAPEVLIHMGVLTKKEAKKIDGLIFNALRKHMPDTRPLDEMGRARNNPNKSDYYEALKDIYDFPNPSRLPSIAVLSDLAAEEGITVYGAVSARQPAPLFHRQEVERTLKERVTMGQRVQAEAVWMSKVRSGELPMLKTPTEDCVRCQLFEYCSADEHDHEEGQELARAILRNRDPYRDHREAMEHGGVVLERRKK